MVQETTALQEEQEDLECNKLLQPLKLKQLEDSEELLKIQAKEQTIAALWEVLAELE